MVAEYCWHIVDDPQRRELPTHYAAVLPKQEACFWSMLGYTVRHGDHRNLFIDPKYRIESMDFSER